MFSSCSDFLDTKSDSRFIESSVVENIDNAAKVVYGGYEILTQGDMWDYNLMWFMCDTDIECSFQNYDGARNDLCHYRANPGTSLLQNTWRKFYDIVERTNIIIDNLPDGTLWTGEHEKEAKRLYAEAVALRAYCYYLLAGFWGDVPFHVTASQPDGELYAPRTDRYVIYEKLLEDLAQSYDYLPWSTDAGTTRRITKGFAKGLRAKIALMYGGYSLRGKAENFVTKYGPKREECYRIARQECLEIMESGKHALKPDWEAIFRDLHEYKIDADYGEIMFEVAYGRGQSGRMAQSLGMFFTTSPADPKYGRAAAEFSLLPHYFYTFDTKDQRRDISAAFFNYGSSSYPGIQRMVDSRNGIKPSKWRRSWIVPNMGGDLKEVANTGVGLPLMRYTDIVLMFAETENELNGPTEAAKSALASVRQRVFDPSLRASKVTHYVDSVAGSKSMFFNALVDERGWEFSGEFYRKFDLIRWNLLGEKKEFLHSMNEGMVETPDDPLYDWIPTQIFWRYMADGETIEILNSDYRLPWNTSISGYSRNTWICGIDANAKASWYLSLERVMNGYRSDMNNYIFPIPTNIINSSNGTLDNDDWRPYDSN